MWRFKGREGISVKYKARYKISWLAMTVTEDLRCNSDFSAELNNNNSNDTNKGLKKYIAD